MLRYLLPLVLILLVACGGAEDRKAAYMSKGNDMFEQGNYEKARLEFQNVLQIDPKDLDARQALAETLEKLENWQGAARHYLAIVGEDPNHRGALLNLGRLFLLSGADKRAQENAEKILAVTPNDAEAMILLAGVNAKAGKRDEARTLAAKVLEQDPANAEAASLMSSLLLVEGDTEGSIELLQRAIGAHPEELALRVNLARVYARAGRADEASATFAEVLKIEPEQISYRKGFARFLMQLKRFDEADAVLRQAIDDFPEDHTAKLAYIEFLSGARGVEEAIAALQEMISENPDDNRFRFALGKVYEASNRIAEADALYGEMIASIEEGPDLLNAKERLAVIKTRQNNLGEARRLVDEVLEESPRAVEALTLRGTLLLNDGDAPSAIADLRTVLRDDPARTAAVRLLARAHVTNKEPELARDVLKQGIEATPAVAELALDLANLHISKKELDEANGVLDQAISRNPNSVPLLEAKFKLLVYQKQYDAALATAERLKQVQPNNVKGYHFAGLVRQAQGDYETSIGEFESALDRTPQAVQPLAQLVKSYILLKQTDKALARLEEIIASQPNHFVARNLLGELHIANGDREAAEKQLNQAIEEAPQWPIPYRNLASLLARSERTDEAVALMKQGIEATNGAALLVTGLASLLENTGNLEAAITEYEKVLAEKPDSQLAANNLAMLLIEYRDDAASWQRARDLVRPLRNTDHAAYLDTVGWVEYKLGEYEQALLFLEKAVVKAPDANLMHYHLGMAHHASGNEVGAREHLTRAVDTAVEFKGMDEARAVLANLESGS